MRDTKYYLFLGLIVVVSIVLGLIINNYTAFTDLVDKAFITHNMRSAPSASTSGKSLVGEINDSGSVSSTSVSK